MINANEYRLGNWVQLNDKAPAKKEFIGKWEAFDFKLLQYPEFYNPIPLTPAILEGCGFVRKDEGLYEKKYPQLMGTFDAFQYEESYAVEYTYKSYSFCHLIFDLHSLQNLIFSLTGTELTITNP